MQRSDHTMDKPVEPEDVLVSYDELDIPTPVDALFGRLAPMVVEIGFGSGRFLTWLSDEFPDWNILGVEVSAACHGRARGRLTSAGTHNVRIVKATGEFVLRDVCPRASVRRVYVNFPDPWPKERHRERRLLTSHFFETVAGRLEQAGEVWLTSDHEEYFGWAVEQGESTGLFDVRRREPDAAFLQTKYAQKWREEGKTIRQAVFRKSGEGGWIPREIELVETMHHATIEGELPEPTTFERVRRVSDDRVVVILKVYRDVSEEGLLFLAHIEEPDLTQRILIEAVLRESDGDRKIVVGVRRFNQPLMTEGTSEAVECVAEWVADQVEGNRIVQRRY